MKYNFLLQLFFLILISCQNTSKDNTNEAYDPFNMTNTEMDKLMACSFIMTYKFQKDKDIIQNTIQRFNSSLQEKAQGKIFTDIFEKCTDSIEEKTYSQFIKNLIVIQQPEYTNDIEKLVDIDYSKYTEESNLDLTMEQQILAYKFQKVKNLFQQKMNNPNQEGNENYVSNTYDITKVPNYIKISLFIGVFGILFIGSFYALKKLTYKPEKKKKKKN